MAGFFKDMLSKKEGFIGDLADDSWCPVPAGQMAAPRVVPPPAPPKDSWISVLKCFGEHLTDEELLIVREQLAS